MPALNRAFHENVPHGGASFEHKLEAAESIPDFAFHFDGILPLRTKDKRSLKTKERQRLLRGLLCHLEQGEWLSFHVGHEADGFSWNISGGAGRQGAHDLSALVSTSLRGLQRAYRFSNMDVGQLRKPLAWQARVSPAAHPLVVNSQGMGFGAVACKEEMHVALPNPWIGKGERMFDSVAQLVMSTPSTVELTVRCEAKRLSQEERQQIAACLETLRRAPLSPLFKEHQLATTVLLDTWLREGFGVRIECSLTADQVLPDQFLGLVGAEVYGCPVIRVNAAQQTQGLNLSDSLPLSLGLPVLLPSAESLAELRSPRVFNIHLPDIPQDGLHLGTAASGTHTTRVALPEEGRSRHTYVVGATGTGKSTLLGGLIQQDIAAGHGVALIDPHGDLFEHVLATMPASRAKDVVLIEPASSERLPGINFLDIPDSPLRRLHVNFVVTEFMNMFNQLYDMRNAGGPMFETYFRNALLLLIESRCPEATILDFSRIFEDKDFRNELCENCENIQVVRFWKQTAERAGGEASLANVSPYITSKLNQLTQTGPIRPIIGQARTTVDFRRLMDHQGILLVNLSKGLLGEMDTRLLGMVLIGQLFAAALGRAVLPQDQRVPFNLYVDEFQNFVTDSIAGLVAEARKFGLQLTLANQTLAQLAATRGQQNLLEAILGNVGNMIAFRLGVPDAERLALFTEPDLPRQELQRLPNYHAFARLLTAERPVDPFVFKSAPPTKTSPHAKQTLAKIRANQVRWASPLAQIEQEITRRFNSTSRWKNNK